MQRMYSSNNFPLTVMTNFSFISMFSPVQQPLKPLARCPGKDPPVYGSLRRCKFFRFLLAVQMPRNISPSLFLNYQVFHKAELHLAPYSVDAYWFPAIYLYKYLDRAGADRR